jgi:hypothetical protein
MVERSTLFEHVDVEIALVAEPDGVPAGHGHRRSGARALEGGIRGFVHPLKPCPAKRQCSRLEVVFAFRSDTEFRKADSESELIQVPCVR